jgi:hypothetical protein
VTSAQEQATRFPSYRLCRVTVTIEPSCLEDPCHVWQGATVWGGYALRRVNGVRYIEHRRVWEEAHGTIPDGWDVHHLCGRRRCINLNHLEALPRGEHIRRHRSEPLPDGVARVLSMQADLPTRATVDHTKVYYERCQRGHELTPDNVVIFKNRRGRLCKTCRMMKRGRRG